MKKIKLTQNQYAIIDDSNFLELSQFNWYAKWEKKTKSFYAGRNVKDERNKWSSITMHRQILKPNMNCFVDRINHNTLDNRKKNLRLVNRSQNLYNMRLPKHNTSGFKGVTWYKALKKWMAYIRKDGKLRYLGYFYNIEDAAIAYNEAAKNMFGEYAMLNIIK